MLKCIQVRTLGLKLLRTKCFSLKKIEQWASIKLSGCYKKMHTTNIRLSYYILKNDTPFIKYVFKHLTKHVVPSC